MYCPALSGCLAPEGPPVLIFVQHTHSHTTMKGAEAGDTFWGAGNKHRIEDPRPSVTCMCPGGWFASDLCDESGASLHACVCAESSSMCLYTALSCRVAMPAGPPVHSSLSSVHSRTGRIKAVECGWRFVSYPMMLWAGWCISACVCITSTAVCCWLCACLAHERSLTVCCSVCLCRQVWLSMLHEFHLLTYSGCLLCICVHHVACQLVGMCMDVGHLVCVVLFFDAVVNRGLQVNLTICKAACVFSVAVC